MKKEQKSFRNRLFASTTLALLLAVLVFWSALFLDEVKAAEVEQPSTQSTATVLDEAQKDKPDLGEDAFVRGLQVKVEVTNKGNESSRNIALDIPLLADLDSPYQVLLEENFSHQPVEINGQKLGSRVMSVEIPRLEPGKSEVIVIDYAVAAGIGSDGAELEGYSNNIEDFLKPSNKVESDHFQIKARAEQVTSGANSDREKVEKIYSFVIDHMSYNENSEHRNKGALAALRSAEGVCEEYASLFVALSRAAGIPARVVNGYADPNGTGEIFQLEQSESINLRQYRHAWVEFYLLEEEGWLPADPTFEHSSSEFTHFGSLPEGSRIAQNYLDLNIQGTFHGGSLALSWNEVLVNN